jgi:hypothetical protein
VLQRRSILKAALALLLPAGRAAASPADFFAHPESAAVIGRAYLEIAPDDAAASRLLPGDHDALRERIVDDFASGRTVRIDGWILAVTEARLCAAVALDQAGV